MVYPSADNIRTRALRTNKLAPRANLTVESGEQAELADATTLPTAVASQIDFGHAAPRRLRMGKRLPPEARAAFKNIWNGLATDLWDELKGTSKSDAIKKSTVMRGLERVAGRVDEANRLLIATAVYSPLRGKRDWVHVSAAASASGAGAGLNEFMMFGSAGTAMAASIATATVNELFETYIAASARVLQYEAVGRLPGPEVIAADLAMAMGHNGAIERRTAKETGEHMLRWMARKTIRRSARRLLRGLVPVVGVGIAAVGSARDVRKVLALPLRPASDAEMRRVEARMAGSDPWENAAEDFGWFLGRQQIPHEPTNPSKTTAITPARASADKPEPDARRRFRSRKRA